MLYTTLECLMRFCSFLNYLSMFLSDYLQPWYSSCNASQRCCAVLCLMSRNRRCSDLENAMMLPSVRHCNLTSFILFPPNHSTSVLCPSFCLVSCITYSTQFIHITCLLLVGYYWPVLLLYCSYIHPFVV